MASSRRPPQQGQPQGIRETLDRLAAQARRFLLRWRLQLELRRACDWALAWLFVLPLGIGTLWMVRGMIGGSPEPVHLGVLVALALFGPVLYVLGRLVWVFFRYRPGRATGLALYDVQLASQDRLVTADEFLSSVPPHGGEVDRDTAHAFMQAAVEDARPHIERASRTELTALGLPAWRVHPASWLSVPATVAIGFWVVLGFQPATTTVQAQVVEVAEVASPDIESSSDREQPQRTDPRRAPRRAQPPLQDPPQVVEPQQVAATHGTRQRNDEAAEGESHAGSSAAARSASTSSNAAGQPSTQKNVSKPKPPEEPKDTADEKDRKPKKRSQRPPEKARTAMETASGKGKSSGSSSVAAQFDLPEQPDKLGAGEPEDEQAEGDEDEDEREKSSGATRPSLRDRKPPVDRNLSPAAGKMGPNKNANGRGGPGARKKTRGVPSMILGIPVPDRVRGMPSPGRSRVTQENAKPTAESHPQTVARARLARSDLAGHVEQMELVPWMQALVRDYFLRVSSEAMPSDGQSQSDMDSERTEVN